MTGPVADLPNLPTAAPDLGQTLLPGLYSADGTLSGIGILAVWALTSVVVCGLVLLRVRLRPELAPHRCGFLALALLWPVPTAMALVAMPVLFIHLILRGLVWASPAWLPLLELVCLCVAGLRAGIETWMSRPDPHAYYQPGMAFQRPADNSDLAWSRNREQREALHRRARR